MPHRSRHENRLLFLTTLLSLPRTLASVSSRDACAAPAQFDLVCAHEWQLTQVQTYNMAGMLAGIPIFGWIGDRSVCVCVCVCVCVGVGVGVGVRVSEQKCDLCQKSRVRGFDAKT